LGHPVKSHYGFVGLTWVNVGEYKYLKRTCQLHFQDQSEREKCVHVMKARDSESAD